MSGKILIKPETPHHCNPGWYYTWNDGSGDLPAGNYAHQTDDRAGTVWQCDCGQVWVAYLLRQGPHSGWNEIYPLRWRKETWRERRKRTKASK